MGAPKYKEYGGGAAPGSLGADWIKFLQGGLSGQFGTGMGSQDANGGAAYGAAGVLNDILSGGAGKMGGSMGEMIRRDTDRQRSDLRARYSSVGGSGYGTPAASAEAMFNAEAAPRATMAIGNMQMDALKTIFPMIANTAGRGITQRQGIMEPSTFERMFNYGTRAIGSISDLVGSFSGGGGGGKGGEGDKNMPQLNNNYSNLVPGAGGFGSGSGFGGFTGGQDIESLLRMLQTSGPYGRGPR